MKGSGDFVVEDPIAVKTKGGPKKKGKTNKCSKCRGTGHNIRSCPKAIGHLMPPECITSSDSEDSTRGSYGVHLSEVGDMNVVVM